MISIERLREVISPRNLWGGLSNVGIPRERYVSRIMRSMQAKEVLVLKGIRRCGKSTIMFQLMDRLVRQGVDREQVIYVNLEEYALQDSLGFELLERILELRASDTDRAYVFLDEIQEIDGWERFVRTIYDRGDPVKFIVSGSNASLLSRELSTLLTGRNFSFEIRPLDYLEYRAFAPEPSFDDYLRFGGFPEVVLESFEDQKRLRLQQYLEDIVYRDVIDRHQVGLPRDLLALALYLIENRGAPLSVNKLARALSIDNTTVDRYLQLLLETFLFVRVDHFSYSAKRRFDRSVQPKYYAIDTGFSQLSAKPDLGRWFENAVLLQLPRRSGVMYWRDGAEVDFVFDEFAVNATFELPPVPREFDGLDRFTKAHAGYEPLIVAPRSGEQVTSFEEFSERFTE